MFVSRWLFVAALLGFGWVAIPAQAAQEEDLAPEAPHSHLKTLSVATEDQELQYQILKINDALEELHQKMAVRKKAIQIAPSDARKATLYAELDGLRKEHDMLERLLHDLVDEAQATEWTKVDEALKRVRDLERYQEKQQRREDVLRDRQE